MISLPIIITGMHRSGTSLTASFLKASGIHLGNHLVQADAFNGRGYFEDVDFLEFQRSLLRDCCLPGEPGWHDWGWTESEYLETNKYSNYVQAARNLITSRQQKSLLWGWKAPRTSLLLDFWQELLPQARYLLVYRFPWDVADSILRLNSPIFSARPDYALKIWAFYNRHLLDFYTRQSERCILFNINAFLQNPSQLLELIETKFDIPLNRYSLPEIYEKQLFNSLDWGHPLVQLVQKIAPQYVSLLAALDKTADLGSKFFLESPPSDSPPLESLVLQLHYPVSGQFKLHSLTDFTSSDTPAISIIIPCFNQGEFILDAIASVENCLEGIYEIIIVNDGSTEFLTTQVVTYLKTRHYFVLEQNNQGLAQARNRGIELAKGRYILPLDADNKIRVNYITKAIDILDKFPKVGVVYGNAELFGEQTGIWEVPEFDLDRLLLGNYIDACAVFRKRVWQECGGYDPNIPDKLGYEDWDLWLSAVEKGWQFYHIPEVLFDYRVRANSMVSACRVPENRRKLLRYICAKHQSLYITTSIHPFFKQAGEITLRLV